MHTNRSNSLFPQKWRNFAEKFSPEEFLKISGVQASHKLLGHRRDKGMYEPIRLTSGVHSFDNTGGYYNISSSGIMDGQNVSYEIMICSTLFEFCRKALSIALEKTSLHFPNWYDYEWVDDDLVSKKYRFTSPYYRDAKKYCWDVLRQAAEDTSLTVTERVEINPSSKFGFLPGNPGDTKDNPVRVEPGHFHLIVVINGEHLSEEINKRIVDLYRNGRRFNPDPTPQRYSFRDMQRYLVELNEREMILLNAAESIPHGTKLNAELHEAVSYLDLERIHLLLERGANPNSVNQLGNTSFANAAETFLWDHFSVEEYKQSEAKGIKDYPEEMRIEVYKMLLSWGADPNLFAYQGNLPLDTSVMSHRALEVAFLLENGADPNINIYPDEESYISSSLETAYTEANVSRIEMEPKDVIERCDTIIELLEKYGARLT